MAATLLTDTRRVSVLRDLAILDTPAETAYDDIAMLAAASCRSAVAAVNFVDHDRHWTKAIVGVEGGQGGNVAAERSLSAATICAPGGLLSVPDLLADEHWQSHPLVTAGPELRFYAGASIMVDLQPVGVVCISGEHPRVITDSDEHALSALARQAAANLELRRRDVVAPALSITDPLTRLPNRTLLLDRLQRAIVHRRRDQDEVGVIFFDLDQFKLVNDLRGREAGDRLLCVVADGMRRACREIDTVARLGGDEFVMICPGLEGYENLDAIVRRVIGTVCGEPWRGGGELSLRVGAVLLEDDETVAAVLQRAEERCSRQAQLR